MSLFPPPPRRPCPGNCAALRAVLVSLRLSSRWMDASCIGAPGLASSGCRECGGSAGGRVVRLRPVVALVGGGLPRRGPGQTLEEWQEGREKMLDQRFIVGTGKRLVRGAGRWTRVVSKMGRTEKP